jgi:large subunit ribosomal protein L13
MDYIFDAKEKKLGRLASEIAVILQGKKNPNYDGRLAGDDRVIVKNIQDMVVSSKKKKAKFYFSHTTQIGHLKKISLEELWVKRGPAEVLRRVVIQMLPNNRLRKNRMKRLIIE